MATPVRTIRVSEDQWKALLKIAKRLGYEDRSALIRGLADGEVEVHPRIRIVRAAYPLPEEEAPAAEEPVTYDKSFDWGA